MGDLQPYCSCDVQYLRDLKVVRAAVVHRACDRVVECDFPYLTLAEGEVPPAAERHPGSRLHEENVFCDEHGGVVAARRRSD